MRKNYTLLVAFLLLWINFGWAQNPSPGSPNYDLAARFSPAKLRKMVFSTQVSPHWLKNSNRFWYRYSSPQGIFYYLVNPQNRRKDLLFENAKLAADMSRLSGDPFDAQHLDLQNLEFLESENKIRFEVKSKLLEVAEKDEDAERGEQQDEKKKKKKPKMVKKTFYFVYDLGSRQLSLLDDYTKPKDDKSWASIAPNEEYVVFARNHNLYWMDMENYKKALKDEEDSTIVETALTEDGIEHYSYARNRRGDDNVKQEKNKDKRKAAGIIWSPDSKMFALTRSDVREVKDLWVINNTANPRPTLETYKYHMPGEKEAPKTELILFDFEAKAKKIIETEAFKDQSISIYQAPRLKKNRDDRRNFRVWLAQTSDRFYFYRTSRDLKRVDICEVNTGSGEVKVLIEERLNTYIDVARLAPVNNGQEFIHWSERDGWGHFYLYDAQGQLKNQITQGPFHCEGIEVVDEKNRQLYFWANGREEGEDPYYLHLYRVNFDGSGLQLLNPGNFNHSVNMSDDGAYFVDNYSRVNSVPASVLYNQQGAKIMDLEVADLSSLMATGYRFPETFTVKAGDGMTDIYGVMYKPYDFDSTRSYPIIAYVYPGPQTEAVNKSFSARMSRTDQLAQVGFIVITLGNRGGHPARSKWYHNYGYGNLRDYGLEDKKVAIEQLSARHSFIDMDKVGIFGHSGGGFMSTAAMLVYPDFFKVAVSSSGNHDNQIYNRWWSEKHHGVKEIENEKGEVSFEYKIDNNLSLAKNLKGKLLICTGDIDNNVHPANTIRLAQALIKANKRFDYFVFPGQRHGYGNMNEYFFWLRADYFSKHLLGQGPSSADMLHMNRDKPLGNR